jgi:hypothetical protein
MDEAMTRTRQLLAVITAAALFGPGALPAQQVPSLLLSVRDGGAPAAGLEVALYRGGNRRVLATTGASGLAVVEFARVPVQPGTRLAVFTVICADHGEIGLTRSVGAPPPADDACALDHVGSAVWGRTERIDIALDGVPHMAGHTARSVARVRSGWRLQAGGSVGIVTGDELSNTNTGFGGELLGGYDATDGWGLGAGASFHRHGLEGVDEKLSRVSVIVEPRYTVIRPDWSARPYFAVRAAREWLDADDGAGLSTETGWSYGAGAGVAIPALGPVGIDLHAYAARLSVSVKDVENSGRGGWLFTVGAGLRF